MTDKKEERSFIEQFKERSRVPFLIMLSLGFLAVIIPEINDYISDWASQSWVSTPATVTKFDSDITVRLKDPYFKVRVAYKYNVYGQEYQGSRLSFLDRGPHLGFDMAQYLQKYEVGKQIDVMVEPGEPEISTIKTEPEHALLFSHCLAVFMVFALAYISTYPPVSGLEETK